MTDNIVKLEVVDVGDGYPFVPDEIIEGAKGKGLTKVVIVGTQADGGFWVSSSVGLGETMVLLEKARHKMVFGGFNHQGE